MKARAALCRAVSVLCAGVWLGCTPAARPAGDKPAPSAAASATIVATASAVAKDPLAPLHAFEEARRAAADFAHLPPSDHAFGPDPTAIRLIPGTAGVGRYVGILRGEDAVVLLDEALREIGRAPAPPSPTGLAVAKDGEIFVSGEQSPSIARYRASGDALRPSGSVEIEGARALRDVAVGGDRAPVLYAVEEHDGRLFALPLRSTSPRREIVAGHGAFRVARAGEHVIVDCLLDHALKVYRLDPAGLPIEEGAVTIRHDGPIWGFEALATSNGLVIAAGGVEDHPLDRTGGSFGFVDSFLFLYQIAPGAAAAERLAEINTSAEGVITPKSIALREAGRAPGGELLASVSGAGGDRLLDISWGADRKARPALSTRAVPPGVVMLSEGAAGALVFADPLLDGWGQIRAGAQEAEPLVPVPARKTEAPPRSAASKLGEALFFTKLMAPWNKSDDRLSRFTCETCHFEGYVDGRTHHTGRGDVHATTKPLLGLFNNRPHFTRALDPDMTTMAHNEFRVAGSLSGHDPWFSAPTADLPWVAALGATAAELEPVELRRALMNFLMELTHRPNPAALGRSAWSAREREGAEVFQRRCERCHSARLVSDMPSSQVPFEQWEAMVFSREGPIVWGRSGYEKTGILPYVHDQGARPPSLRRLFKKRPYFTNGSARELRDVLEQVRFGAAENSAVFYHAGAPADAGLASLSDGEKQAVLAFLDLL